MGDEEGFSRESERATSMALSHPSVTVSQGPPGLAEPVGGLQGHPEFSGSNGRPTLPQPAM